jgi:hypothetical protein
MILAAAVPIPTGGPNTSFEDTERSPLVDRPAGFYVSRPTHRDLGDSDIALIIASGYETPLAAEITTLTQDLEGEGYNVTTHVMTGGTATDLRSYLQSQTGLGGAILLGHLPAAWYEMTDWGQEEFPLDLYLMDLDGNWSDSDGDGLYDSHSGDRAPEIWVGRIDAHAMQFGSEIAMLKGYLNINHMYRTGQLTVPDRAMAFNDDDWNYYGDADLGAIYSQVDVYQSSSQTTADYYKDRLEHGYEFVHLMSHSSPWGHTFKDGGGYAGTVMAPEISCINPVNVFVQLFACSNCRWTEPNCLGNWYLFGTDNGLLAMGATKTGSMLSFDEFYGPIGEGDIPGIAFRKWFSNVGIYDRAWHYGCVLLGDPTIMPASRRGGGRSGSPILQGMPRETYQKVSSSAHSDCYPAVASNGDRTCVAWVTGQNGRLDLQARILDGGSWGSIYTVDPDEYWDVTPSAAIDGSGQAYVAWSDFVYSTYGYCIKVATGSGFGSVTVEANGNGYDVDPHLAYTDRMWLVWQVWRRAEGDVMVKSLDGSYSPTYLSGSGTEDFSPTAAAGPDGKLHVAWVEGSTDGQRIMWCSGDQGGFSSPQEVSSGSFCRAPSLGCESGRMFLSWQEESDGASIKVREWGGSSWGSETTLFSSSTEQPFEPSVGTSTDGDPLVAWQQGQGYGATVWCCEKNGSTWTSPSVMVFPDGPAWLPATGGGQVAWSGTGGGSNWDIYIYPGDGTGVSGRSSASVTGPDFRLLGNPVGSSLLVGSRGFDGGAMQAEVAVYDVSGRLVQRGAEASDATGVLTVDTSSLPCGVYTVAVTVDGSTWTERFTRLR